MNKIDILYGFLIGLVSSLIGCYIFVTCTTSYDFVDGMQILNTQGYLGKVVTLGSLVNLVSFGVLLKKNKEITARGVVLAVFTIAIFTLFLS